MNITILPLEWEKDGDRWHAKTPLGSRYTVGGADYRGHRTVNITTAGEFGDAVGDHVAWVKSAEEGFAAAQTDYEQRIRSALHPAPNAREAGLDGWKAASLLLATIDYHIDAGDIDLDPAEDGAVVEEIRRDIIAAFNPAPVGEKVETDDGAVRITLYPRPDGGLRVLSPDLPGLILSGGDPAQVAADIPAAIRMLQEHRLSEPRK